MAADYSSLHDNLEILYWPSSMVERENSVCDGIEHKVVLQIVDGDDLSGKAVTDSLWRQGTGHSNSYLFSVSRMFSTPSVDLKKPLGEGNIVFRLYLWPLSIRSTATRFPPRGANLW